jgi:NADPH-dependent 2,4-dienoyl-CoA reductase/sulfur reductase-like enzyme
VQSFDVLDEIVLVGKRVVVIGAGRVGLETAEYLRARDREVIVLSRRQVSEIGQDLPWPQGGHFLRRLDEMGVKKQGKVRVQEITDDGVVCSIDGKSEFLPADTVVLALGADGNSGLAKAFQTTVSELHLIGDCIEARNCLEAIHEGYKVSMTI